MPDEKPKKDKKDEEPEKKKEMVYPEGGIDGMIIRDGAPADMEYPLPEPSGIIITDQIDTARVELKKFRDPPEVVIKNVHDVAFLARGMEDYDRERLKVLHLDTKNRVLAVENISTGSVDAALVHPREAVKGAVLSNATSVVIVHNHPSGSTDPSGEDILVAQALVNAFSLMKINVLDFVIVGKDALYSFKDVGEMPSPQAPVLDLVQLFQGNVAETEACQLAYRAAMEVLEEQCGK
uniref:Putative DNA repair protein n=1 Tax=viral metagenome TaxID=1070528 RepID=A0A6M3LSS0_9ZZZZ